MLYTRRDLGKIALAAPFASTLMGAAAKPNSLIKGVQIGVIAPYSYGAMGDSTAEATLKYIIDSGISAVELMGDPINDWAKKKGKWDSSPAAAAEAAANAGGRGRGGFPGGMGSRGQQPSYAPVAGMKTGMGNGQAAGQWNGQTCPANSGMPGMPGGGMPGGSAPGGAGQAGGGMPGGMPNFGGFGRGEQTAEQKAAAEAERKWRMGLSMDIFKELRKYYNDAGVTIFAVKEINQLQTDEDLEFTFTVGRTLGATHVTLELPSGDGASERLKKLGDAALKYKMYMAYHTHEQGSMTAFDEAFAVSKGNLSNVDLGHFVAANSPELAVEFLKKFHDKIASFHLKDRTTKGHCSLNLPWGYGETPFKELLGLVTQNKWQMPATIELEYSVPEGSTSVKEVARCLEYCRKVMA